MKRLLVSFYIQTSLRGCPVRRKSTNHLSGGTAGTDTVGTIPSTDELSRVDYCGNVVYDRGERRLLTDEGYVTFAADGTPQYHFYLRDHLGNIRVVFDQAGTVEQVTHYYPFGGVMRESTNPAVQPYKYGGKELDRTSGLDAYDFGARMFFADRLQWGQIDPLCEKYYDWSPYNYCVNRPVNVFDPNGRDDYYWPNGKLEYRDDSETDRIMLTRWAIYVELEDKPELISINGTPIEDLDDISAETYSNIFTSIVSEMPDTDLSGLKQKSISVVVWNGKEEDGQLYTTNYYNRPDFKANKIASTGNTRITAFINLFDSNSLNYYSTVSNVQNILGIHEYKGHYVKKMGDSSKDHYKIYEMQMNDPTWAKITETLKQNIINNYRSYRNKEIFNFK